MQPTILFHSYKSDNLVATYIGHEHPSANAEGRWHIVGQSNDGEVRAMFIYWSTYARQYLVDVKASLADNLVLDRIATLIVAPAIDVDLMELETELIQKYGRTHVMTTEITRLRVDVRVDHLGAAKEAVTLGQSALARVIANQGNNPSFRQWVFRHMKPLIYEFGGSRPLPGHGCM